ncbi:MAG: NAD(P)-binding domain-containing protein [Anaerolineae bacterium]|nr:NAD(P)-binding domain-containing protein [Anaerolineae bacterium]
MQLGIIGAGNIGGTLGKRWAQQGHQIVFGVRDPNSEKAQKALAAAGAQARLGTVAEAVAAGEVILLAVPWYAVREAVQAGGDWSGKVVIDAVNHVGSTIEQSPSVAETLWAMMPSAQVVKGFNMLGWNIIEQPDFGGIAADCFICGDHAGAKQTVAALVRETGLEVVDCGSLQNAVILEALARLWIKLSLGEMGREIAFKLLGR